MEITNLQGGQLRTERAELDVASLNKTFVLPLIGPNYHKNAMEQVDSQGLYRPTTAQVLSLVDFVLDNKENPYCAKILRRFKRYLWTGTETTSFKDGAIVYDNIDGKMPSDSKGLIKLLDSGDKRVRLVKPGFESGNMSISKFLKNSYTIAQIGEEMLPVAERIAKAFDKTEAYVFGIDKEDLDEKRLTAVGSYWDDDRRLSLGGCFVGGCYFGYVSGVAPGRENEELIRLFEENKKLKERFLDQQADEEDSALD